MTWNQAFNDEGDPVDGSALHTAWQIVYDGDRKHNTLYRMTVPGGWLYRIEGSKEMTFVPNA